MNKKVVFVFIGVLLLVGVPLLVGATAPERQAAQIPIQRMERPEKAALDRASLEGRPAITLQSPGSDPFEPNDSPEEATYTDYYSWRGALIDPAGDRDFYTFYASRGDRVLADIDAFVSGSALGAALILYAQDGETVLAADTAGGAGHDPAVEYVVPVAGNYYLEVRAVDHPAGGGGSDHFYWLFLTGSDPYEPNNRASTATPIEFGDVIEAAISPRGDFDFYQFQGETGETVTFDIDAYVNGSFLDSTLTLYDANGFELAYSDDYTEVDAHLSYVLPADGTYYLRVADYAYGDGGPQYFYKLTFDSIFYISAQRSGTLGGVPFEGSDILAYSQGNESWALVFDGSDVGITANVAAFDWSLYGCLLLVFSGNQFIDGLGTIRPQDVVEFCPLSLGEQTDGFFNWFFDGSDVGLSTSAEAIDALDFTLDYQMIISTRGNFNVPVDTPGPGPYPPPDETQMLRGRDEDLLAFSHYGYGVDTYGQWYLYLDGSAAVPGLGNEDVSGVSVGLNGVILLTIENAFNLGGVQGDENDVITLVPNDEGTYTVQLYWDGSANGFRKTLDGFAIP